MDAKYFSAPEQETCFEQAEAHFGLKREQLFCRFMPIEEGENPLLMAVKPGIGGMEAAENMNGFFILRYLPEYVQLEIFHHRGHGHKLNPEEFDQYLNRKALTNVNQAAISKLLNKGFGYTAIALPQNERVLNEEVQITLDASEMHAFISLLPRDEGGALLDEQSLRQSLKAENIVYGINEEVLKEFLREKQAGKKYQIADGTPAERGKDGRLTYFFRQEFTGRPKEIEDGRVDYRTLDLFENVKKDQLLVTRTLATEGAGGRTVTGKEIPASPGKDVRMPNGKNIIINEDGTTLRAAVGGMVVYSNNNLSISNVYQVDEVDLSIGNIDFDGSVMVRNNILSGMTVKATGNIEVGGSVEGATLIADGNIVLKQGIQGGGRGVLQAGGNITASYIERATVLAGGIITANSIAYSIIEAGDSLRLSGKNGSLLAGVARASNTVAAQVVGTAMEINTEVEVGLVPHKRERIRFLQQETARLPGEIDKLSTIISYLDRNPSEDPKKAAMRVTVDQNLYHNKQLLVDYTDELNTLAEESANAVHGKVHISDTIYPGVRLTIASSTYKVEKISERCTFRISEGDIVLGPYEGR